MFEPARNKKILSPPFVVFAREKFFHEQIPKLTRFPCFQLFYDYGAAHLFSYPNLVVWIEYPLTRVTLNSVYNEMPAHFHRAEVRFCSCPPEPESGRSPLLSPNNGDLEHKSAPGNINPEPNLPAPNKEWEQAAENDPGLSARRRAYECEILVLRHRMGCDGANNASLAAAFHLLRARVNQQRRAREWFARATARREALLFRSVFDALARGSRSRAAEAAATAARCRAGLAAWKKAVSLSRKVRTMRWRRERATAVKGFQRWRQRCAWMVMAPGGGGVTEEEEGLEWRLELFRERRAKRVVFRAWREASQITAAVAVMDGRARGGITGRGGRGHRRGRYRGFSCFGATERDELTPCPSWGARLRAVEVKKRNLTVISSAGTL